MLLVALFVCLVFEKRSSACSSSRYSSRSSGVSRARTSSSLYSKTSTAEPSVSSLTVTRRRIGSFGLALFGWWLGRRRQFRRLLSCHCCFPQHHHCHCPEWTTPPVCPRGRRTNRCPHTRCRRHCCRPRESDPQSWVVAAATVDRSAAPPALGRAAAPVPAFAAWRRFP